MRKLITLVFLLTLFNVSCYLTIVKGAGYTFKEAIKEFWGILLFGNVAITCGLIFLV